MKHSLGGPAIPLAHVLLRSAAGLGNDILRLWIYFLVVIAFVVQHYKIPTPSMEPTLVSGDHILVSKFHYYLAPIRRFDVVVFKSPLDTNKNIVKRVTGLPGEEWMISDGDIYYRTPRPPNTAEPAPFHLARKPLSLQAKLWRPLANQDFLLQRDTFLQYWDFRGVPGYESFQCSAGSLKLPYLSEARKTTFIYRGSLSHPSAAHLGDFRISFSFSAEVPPSGTGRIFATIQNAHGFFELSVHPVRATMTLFVREIAGPQQEWLVPVPSFRPEAKHDLDFFFYDGTVGVRLDGVTQLQKEIRSERPSFTGSLNPSAISFGSESAGLTVTDLKLYRDIVYHSGGSESNFQDGVPALIDKHSYVVLGDNVEASQDCRRWKYYRLLLRNGTSVMCDVNELREGRRVTLTDVFGQKHDLDPQSIVERQGPYPLRFLDRNFVLGRPFLIYLPRAEMIR